jgi:hypothetical protein
MARFRDLQKMYPECMRQLWALRPEMPAKNAPVAQLDRAPDYESGGQEFESLRARHLQFYARARRRNIRVAVGALSLASVVRRSTRRGIGPYATVPSIDTLSR